jgi:hypothetical protein
MNMNDPCCSSIWLGVQIEQSRQGRRPFPASILFFSCFLARSFTSQSRFHPLFLARFQVEGVSLDLLDDVFLLYLALEPAQRVLERFAFLYANFSQKNSTSEPAWKAQFIILDFLHHDQYGLKFQNDLSH